MRKISIVLLSFLLLSCAGGGKASLKDKNLIFKIGNSKVYLNEFLFYLQNNYKFAKEEKDSEVLSAILDDFIESRMLVFYLRERNLHPTASEIAEYIKFTGQEKKVSNFDINEKRMFALHISFILAEEKLKNYLIGQLPNIKEEEVTDYYEKHVEDYFREKTYCFIRFYSSHKDLLLEARRWLVKKRKKPDFIKLRYQDVKVSDTMCFEESELPEIFLKTLSGAKKNRVTKIVETTLGKSKLYNMFLLKSVQEQKKIPINEEYDNIVKKLKKIKLNLLTKKFKKDLMKKYKVIVYPDNLLIMDYKGKFEVEEQ
jgi:hypothetical protein